MFKVTKYTPVDGGNAVELELATNCNSQTGPGGLAGLLHYLCVGWMCEDGTPIDGRWVDVDECKRRGLL